MKVQQLFLRNVRSIKSLDLDFRDPVTGKPMSRIVLAGANGSGKTTILECLFGLLSTAGTHAPGGLLQGIGIHLPIRAQLQLLFEVTFPDNLPAILSISGNKPVIDESSITEEVIIGTELSLPPSSRSRLFGVETTEELPRFGQLAESIQIAGEHQGDALGSILYFPHNRYLPSVKQGELGFEPRVYQWAHRYRASEEWKGSTESHLFSLNYLDLEDYRDRRMSANRFSQTVEPVNSILDGKRITRIERGRAVVETSDGQTHGLNDMSSGEKQLALLLIEITRRIVPGSVILIDEPEISLHPAWQRGLVVALDKITEQYDAQVIMATHSPEIASMILPQEVIFLSDLNVPSGKWNPEKEVLA